MSNYDPYIRDKISDQNGLIERQNELLEGLLNEFRLANDLKIYEIGRKDNAAEIALLGTMAEKARGERLT